MVGALCWNTQNESKEEDKGENRDREIRKPRPSIRAQLKADKAKTAPKKAAAKTKNHDMEV